MPAKRKTVALLFIVGIAGITLWIGLDAVMRGVTEMEKNMGGARQAVKDDRMRAQDD